MRHPTGWRERLRHERAGPLERGLSIAIALLLLAAVSATAGDTTRRGVEAGPTPTGDAAAQLTGAETSLPEAGVSGGDTAPPGKADAEATNGPRSARGTSPRPGTAAGSSAGPRGGGCGFEGCERAQGVTDSEIKLGFMYFENTEQLFSRLGAEGFQAGDARRMVRALTDDVNRRGGILGRKINPVFAAINSTTADPDGELRKACVTLTEDEKVFAGFLGEPTTAACFASHKTLLINSATADVGDDEFLRTHVPWVHWHSNKSHTRVWRTLLPVLQKGAFFATDGNGAAVRAPKVGLLVWDRPRYINVSDRLIKPALRRSGLAVEEFRIVPFAADMQAQVQQAVFRFKNTGVTHVAFVPGLASFFFMQAAENQQYRPRYALDSTYVPGSLVALAPKPQLRGMTGIGWIPQVDVLDPQHPYSPQERRCMDLMKKAGVNVQSRMVPYFAMHYCDIVWFFEAAALRAGRSLTSGSLVGAITGLGAAWPSLLTFRSNLVLGTPDGSHHHRLLAWREGGCGRQAPDGCFEYRGELQPDVES